MTGFCFLFLFCIFLQRLINIIMYIVSLVIYFIRGLFFTMPNVIDLTFYYARSQILLGKRIHAKMRSGVPHPYHFILIDGFS